MFELTTPTDAKLTDVVVLSQKNRQPDENPGAKLSLEIDLSGETISMFDGRLRSFLFEPNHDAQQGALDGMAQETLSAAGRKLGWLKWTDDHVGFLLTIDFGMGGASNLVISGCTLSGWRLKAKAGNSYTVKVNAESADISETNFGRLAKLKSRVIKITIVSPEVAQQPLIDAGLPEKRPKGHKGPWPFGDKGKENAPAKSAEETFADQHGAPA